MFDHLCRDDWGPPLPQYCTREVIIRRDEMGLNSKIEWTESTWNPITGCTKVSAGCAHCYGERIAPRIGVDFSKIKLYPERLEQPHHWYKPKKIFVCSMSDLFHEDVPNEFIIEIFLVMANCERHIFQILTKRPERMKAFISTFSMMEFQNIWLGVSCENQLTVDERIPILLQTPAAIRFVSIEPMLLPVDLSDYISDLDWIIVGCESGPNRRSMEINWVRNIKNQCLKAGVPFFFKQAMIDGKLVKMPGLDEIIWDQFPKEINANKEK